MSGHEEWIEVLRDEVRYARENNLCPCGVRPANCAHHKPKGDE